MLRCPLLVLLLIILIEGLALLTMICLLLIVSILAGVL
jgi:hypothetical protein